MTSTNHGGEQQLAWLLDRFIKEVPGAEAIVLSSTDGIKRAWSDRTVDPHALEADQVKEAAERAEKQSAVMSGLYSLSRNAHSDPRRNPGEVRQIVIERADHLLFVAGAGHGSLLGARVTPSADRGAVGYALTHLVKSVYPHLITPARAGGQPSAPGR